MRTQLRQQKEDKEPNNDWGGKGVHQSKCTCQWVIPIGYHYQED